MAFLVAPASGITASANLPILTSIVLIIFSLAVSAAYMEVRSLTGVGVEKAGSTSQCYPPASHLNNSHGPAPPHMRVRGRGLMHKH